MAELTAVEKLDALPAFAVILIIRDGQSAPAQKDTNGEWRFPGLFEGVKSEDVADLGTITLIHVEEAQ